jgi:hypothetical protein
MLKSLIRSPILGYKNVIFSFSSSPLSCYLTSSLYHKLIYIHKQYSKNLILINYSDSKRRLLYKKAPPYIKTLNSLIHKPQSRHLLAFLPRGNVCRKWLLKKQYALPSVFLREGRWGCQAGRSIHFRLRRHGELDRAL